jgi:flagellar biosynthesis chaperone FliJ
MVKLAEQLDTALVDLKNLQEKERQHELHIEQLTEQRNHYREMSLRGRTSQDVGVSPMKVATSPLKPVPSIQQVEEDRELKRKLAEAVEAVGRVTKQIDDLLVENKEIAKQSEGMKKEIDDKKCVFFSL